MIFVWIILAIFLVIVGVGIIGGAPFVPTRKVWIREALELAKISRNDVVLDLGSGDGAVLAEAVKTGAKRAVGIELNPVLVLWSRLRLAKISRKIRVESGDVFAKKWPSDTTVIYIFQVSRVMKKVPQYIRENRENFAAKKLKVVCFSFELPGEKVVATNNGMRLYEF